MATSLDRDDIIAGLSDLIVELRSAGQVAGIRLVGGAALALRYFDRGTTRDLDTLHVRPGSDAVVAAAAARVAQRHDWDPNWLNFEVAGADALPTLGRAVEWDTIYEHEGIVIEVASKEALLVMKLRKINVIEQIDRTSNLLVAGSIPAGGASSRSWAFWAPNPEL